MNNKVKNLRVLNVIDEIDDYAILLLDKDGYVENWNKGAQKIKGYKPEDIIGKHFSVFYTPADRENKKPEMLINLARKTGRAFDEGWRIRKDNTRFWGSITITAMTDDEKNVVGFIKITRDLTDKMLAAEAISQNLDTLQVKNQELEQFVYIASHDLQEPLLTISNFIHLLQAEYGHLHNEDGNMYMGFIEQAAERMRFLIKDLLDYSRIGKVRETEQVDVNELLKHIIDDLDNRIAITGSQIQYGHLPTVKAYRTEFRQLFQNLISNAIKFSKKNEAPVISINAEAHSNGWKFTVQDNGIGIEAKHCEKIFLIFQRLHNRDDYPGTGIGLANCKKIVAMHNGNIGVESVPGVGSTFWFTLEL
jgi:PAS domain S-box-containing protein